MSDSKMLDGVKVAPQVKAAMCLSVALDGEDMAQVSAMLWELATLRDEVARLRAALASVVRCWDESSEGSSATEDALFDAISEARRTTAAQPPEES